jgi:uncharacterized phage protein (TIGR02218 family)
MLDSGMYTISFCWTIAPVTGSPIRCTDFDQDITIGSDVYSSVAGFKRTAVRFTEGLSVDNLDVTAYLSAALITQADIMSGRFDGATITVGIVDHMIPSSGLIILMRGRLGDMVINREELTVQLDSLLVLLEQTYAEITSPGCRYLLGDASTCKVAMGAYTRTGQVNGSIVNNMEFTGTVSGAGFTADYFTNGELVWTTGPNAGLTFEVRSVATPAPGTIKLHLPCPYPIAAGNQYSLKAGCDKSIGTCASKFSNGVNFGGEPTVPGNDKVNKRGDL